MSSLKKVILQYAPDYNSGRAEVVLDGEDFVLGHSLGGAAAQLVEERLSTTSSAMSYYLRGIITAFLESGNGRKTMSWLGIVNGWG